MSYEMKKSLRKQTGPSRSYSELKQEEELNLAEDVRNNSEREGPRQSIFEHKNWRVKQRIRLMVFLQHYHCLTDWSSERRSIHLYKHLSNFMKKARTPEQCKNIHSLLKRKFSSLEEIVRAMQGELQHEDNYEKMLLKYEREIQKFEEENQLLEGRQQKKYFEALRSKKAVQKFEKQCDQNVVKKLQAVEKEESGEGKANEKICIKQEQMQVDNSFGAERQRFIRQCDFHFKEWLKCAAILEMKNKNQQF